MNPICLPKKTAAVIVNASWEERFFLGLTRLFEDIRPLKVLMFYYQEYEVWSNENMVNIDILCEKHSIILKKVQLLSNNTAESWRIVVQEVLQFIQSESDITLDISTMPREVVWYICHLLFQQNRTIQYAYHKPEKYGDWLTKDPGKPRLLYKQSGIQSLGKKTALFIQTGFDIDRVKQLIRFYEPSQIVLALQIGDQFENIRQNRENHRQAFEKSKNTVFIDIDGYSLSESYLTLINNMSELIGTHNVIMSSLGPKIGALSIHLLQNHFPSIALSYAPSKEYNIQYSIGLGETKYGIITDK